MKPVASSEPTGARIEASGGMERESVACELCGRDDPRPLVIKNRQHVVQCRLCGLVYVNPRPTPAALAALYARAEYCDEQIERATDARNREQARARLSLVERSRDRRGSLLDVGCSAGWFLQVATDAGWRATGLDVSPAAVAHCRSRGLDAMVGTLASPGLAGRRFDVVTLFDSLEHMPSPLTALRAARALLAEDGVLVVTTPNVDGLLPRFTYRVFARTLGAWEHPTPPAHVDQFGTGTLRRLLERAGFELAHVETEAIPLAHSVGELEDELVDALKRRRGDGDTRVEVAVSRGGSASPLGPRRVAQRAARLAVHAVAWTVVHAIGAPAPLLGRGDSLVVIARRALS